MYEHAKIRVDKIPELLEKYNGQLTFSKKQGPKFLYQWKVVRGVSPERIKMDNQEFFESVKEFLVDMEAILGMPKEESASVS